MKCTKCIAPIALERPNGIIGMWLLRPGRVRFRDAYDDAKVDYFTEIGASPRLTKDAITGAVFKTGLKLIESEDATSRYRGCDALLRASKIRGWFGEGEDQSVLGTLSARRTQGDGRACQPKLKTERNCERRARELAGKLTAMSPQLGARSSSHGRCFCDKCPIAELLGASLFSCEDEEAPRAA